MKELRPKNREHLPNPARHPIAVVAERTGLSQDVLRVWERRYEAVKPARGTNGQRFYTDADVERLRVLHAATRAGRNISQVAKLSDNALKHLLAEDAMARAQIVSASSSPANAADLINTALALAQSLHGIELNDHLRRALALLGVPDFLSVVAVPLLRRVGDEWHAGRLTAASEHLASSVLHDIFVESMRAYSSRADSPRILIATPAGERHAIGAALVGAAAAVEGWGVVYLGADLPAQEISRAAIATDARVVALSVLYVEDRDRILAELRSLRSQLPAAVALFVGGSGAQSLARDLTGHGIRVTENVAELYDELRRAK